MTKFLQNWQHSHQPQLSFVFNIEVSWNIDIDNNHDIKKLNTDVLLKHVWQYCVPDPAQLLGLVDLFINLFISLSYLLSVILLFVRLYPLAQTKSQNTQ